MTTKLHSTNYADAFIRIAEDCPVATGTTPPDRGGKPTVAGLQHSMLFRKAYSYTSDDVVFATSAAGRALDAAASTAEHKQARETFFSKGQPCLRASPLTKQFGWGVHSDAKGRVAIYAVDSPEYRTFAANTKLTQLTAMRTKRA